MRRDRRRLPRRARPEAADAAPLAAAARFSGFGAGIAGECSRGRHLDLGRRLERGLFAAAFAPHGMVSPLSRTDL